ncbi:MerR family transcriptional regulator [Enterococcus alishanensis]
MLTINQFSKAAQIPAKTLHYYDEIGLLKPAKIDAVNNYRYYSVQQLADVITIHYLKKYDSSLAEIQQVLKDESFLPTLLNQKQHEMIGKAKHYQKLQEEIATDITALAEGGDFMLYKDQIKLVNSPTQHLFSVRETINIKNFGQLMEKLFSEMKIAEIQPMGAPMAIYHSDEYTPENYDLELAVPIQEVNKSTRELPAYQAAKLAFKGNYQEMPAVYASLSQWIAENNYHLIDSPFEYYETDPSEAAPDENEVIVYFPVVRS